MILLYVELLAGIGMLYLGAEGLVWGGTRLALRLRVAPMVIGLSVVAFGTSLPEFTVSLYAVIQGAQAIAIGNVVGSNIANVSLILAISAIIFPVIVVYGKVRNDLLLAVAITMGFMALSLDGRLSRIDGAIMTIGIVLYVWRLAKRPTITPAVTVAQPKDGLGRYLLAIVAGLVLLVLGTHFFIESAVAMARLFGLSELVIGATIVAIGTSLPELATSLVAAVRKQSEIVLGNIIGSNVFNMIGVMGIIPLIQPVNVPARALYFQMPLMLGLTLVLVPLLRYLGGIQRGTGIALLTVYVLFVISTFVLGGGQAAP